LAVYIGVYIWFKFCERGEIYLLDRFCKEWDLSADRKKRMMGFGWGAGRRETSCSNRCIGKMKCNTT